MNFLKPFDKNISFKKLFFYWGIFLFIGIFLMLVITPLSPSFVEQQNEISENLCEPINLIFLSLAFLIETIIFMVLPWKIFGKRGLVVGLVIWAGFHLIGGNLPIFLYIGIMSVFYYRLLEIKRVFSVFFFHFLINLPAIFSCFI